MHYIQLFHTKKILYKKSNDNEQRLQMLSSMTRNSIPLYKHVNVQIFPNMFALISALANHARFSHSFVLIIFIIR